MMLRMGVSLSKHLEPCLTHEGWTFAGKQRTILQRNVKDTARGRVELAAPSCLASTCKVYFLCSGTIHCDSCGTRKMTMCGFISPNIEHKHRSSSATNSHIFLSS